MKFKNLFETFNGKNTFEDENGELLYIRNSATSGIIWKREGGDLRGAPPTAQHSFTACNLGLTSLEGSPEIIGDDFEVSGNRIASLKGAPVQIYHAAYFSSNKIRSLKGCPTLVKNTLALNDNEIEDVTDGERISVGKHLFLSNNKIKSLVGISNSFERINGFLKISGNPIEEGGVELLLIPGLTDVDFTDSKSGLDDFRQLEIILNKYLKQKKGDSVIYDAQQELIDAGLEEFAIL